MPGKRSVQPNGAKIRELRHRLGFSTWGDLAAAIQRLRQQGAQIQRVSESTIRDAERGRPIYPGSLRAIAAGLNVDCESLLAVPVASGLTMFACQQDFLAWERERSSSDTLRIKTIAINLANGWDNIVAAIDRTRAAAISFSILMLTDRRDLMPADIPREVEAWVSSASANLRLVQAGAGAYRGAKRVSLEIRTYREVPTFHGMKVECPAVRHYLTQCRALAGELGRYDWGEGAYLIVPGDSSDPDLISLRACFDRHFSRLWRAGGPAVLKVHCGHAS